MPAHILAFGHGFPLDHPVLAGLAIRDVTRGFHPAPTGSRLADRLEPFLDPFVRSFLFGLEAGAFAKAAAILIWRQGAGALHAYRYACEFRRLGMLPDGPPLFLWNAALSSGAAAQRFDAHQAAILGAALDTLPRGVARSRAPALAELASRQAAGALGGAEAFGRRMRARASGTAPDLSPSSGASGPRLALAGAPLGGDGLHRWLDRQGALVLDLQGPDAPTADPRDLLRARRVEALVWQVDPHDDLHGWRMPGLRALCGDLGVRFVDLGFVPSWPKPADLPEALP